MPNFNSKTSVPVNVRSSLSMGRIVQPIHTVLMGHRRKPFPAWDIPRVSKDRIALRTGRIGWFGLYPFAEKANDGHGKRVGYITTTDFAKAEGQDLKHQSAPDGDLVRT